MGVENNKSNNIKIISHHTYLSFQSTLNNAQANSVFQAFHNADKYDENGKETILGDNQLTGEEVDNFFKAIGEDLKQKFFKKLKNDEIANCLRYSDDEFNFNKYDKKKYDKAIKSINTENIESIIFGGRYADKGREFVQQLESPHFKNNAEPRSLKEIDSDCKQIRKVIQKWCKEHGIDTSELDKQQIKTEYGYTNDETGEYVKFESPMYDSDGLLNQYVELMNNYRNTQQIKEAMMFDSRKEMQEAINKRYEEAQKSGEELTTTNPSQNEMQKKLQNAVDSSKKLLNVLEKNEKFADKVKEQKQHIKESELFLNDKGNGKFDKVAMQLIGNCWLLSGINSLVATNFGKEFLERNIIKDEEKHIFAVHLQEAENRGFPRPKGDGIYVFSEKEVLDIQNMDNGLASGEGEVAAFALAIETYFKERNNGNIGKDQERFSDGNTDYRFFEIVTGKQQYDYKYCDSGIQYVQAADIGDGETRLNYFDQIYEMVKNKTAAITLGHEQHSFSVTGVDGDYILIQESNSIGSYKDKFELIEDSFPPTYKVPKDVFEKTFSCFAAMRWE